MAEDRPDCRLYGILAREAPVAVLFRRGPSKEVQVISWDTSSDRFNPGQWFKGRIYERRCDLSPDGRLLVYFAASWKSRLGPDGGSWTAVSRPPYLTALARWVKGDAWNGGGMFLDNKRLGLNNGGTSHRWAGSSQDGLPLDVSNLDLGQGEDDPLETTRETRDGWKVLQEMGVNGPRMPLVTPPPTPAAFGIEDSVTRDFLDELTDWLQTNDLTQGFSTNAPRILLKELGPWRLRREERLEGYRLDRRYSVAGLDLDLGGSDWAEIDHGRRLVFTKAGCLFAATSRKDEAPVIVKLADFNPSRFAPTEAPEWAARWE